MMEEAYKNTGINNILVDTTKQKELPDVFQLLDIFSELPLLFKSALIFNKSQASAKEIRFMETISVNRDKNMRCFYNREQAVDWLKSK
jgi:hypothetical protein